MNLDSLTLLYLNVNADELVADTSSLGVILYLYTASITVHCFLAVTFFILWYHLSAMPLPLGVCTHGVISLLCHCHLVSKLDPPFVKKALKLSAMEDKCCYQ